MVKRHGMQNRYFIMFIFLSFLGLFFLVIGVSYSFFTTTVKGKEFVIYTGDLAVDYIKKTDVINIENLYPMTDAEGLQQMSHEFTVTNTGNIEARYQVRLELDETLSDMVDIRYIKLSYQVNGGEYSTPILLSDLNSSMAFIQNVVVAPNQSNHYGIKLWIDLSAPNDIQGKMFKARVVVDSIQNVEDGYVVDTVPIIYLNTDSHGNQDIHLKTNEPYTELGVERVEDDQEIFTADQVRLSYEYYDGEKLSPVSSVDTSKNGIYYVTYSITDQSGNIGKKTRVVTVNRNDNVPSITLNGNSTITLGERDDYQELGVTVADNHQVITIGEVKTSTVGTYVIRYIVVDSNGNLNSVIRTVIVNKAYQESILNGADPVLTNNLIPVQIADDGTVTRASTASTWYSYENKNWANAVVLKDEGITYQNGETIPEDNIESYFVWIPKYSYQLWDLGNYDSLASIEAKEQTIPIKFGLTNTSDSNTGECTTPGVAGESGSCQVGDYMTHPAFLAFDSNGLWVGKFETGYDGATTPDEAQVNSNDSNKIIIKPNVYSWRSLTLGNMFSASYNYLRSDESHMMKNTEWGAVAYLQHSAYGSQTSVRVNNNSAYITGYAGTEEPTLGENNGTSIDGNRVESTALGVDGTYTVNYLNLLSNVASTTGNKSGIYDMSGGAWEYAMGYTTGASTIGGNSGITTLYSDFFTNSNWDKYYDEYSSTGIHDYNNRILGDATGELGPFESQLDMDATRYKSSWHGDYAHFMDFSAPWFACGGSWNNGTPAGVFAFSPNTGDMSVFISFRVVLAP